MGEAPRDRWHDLWQQREADMANPDSSERSGSAPAEPVASIPPRGRGAVAASILAVLLVGAFFAAAPGGLRTPWGEFLLNAAILSVAFWFAALRVGGIRDLRDQWVRLAVWILAWTLAWDLATSGILMQRAFFQEWWIVYPAGLLFLSALLLIHAAILDWTGRRAARGVRDAPDGPG
jgi:hypothetical protein